MQPIWDRLDQIKARLPQMTLVMTRQRKGACDRCRLEQADQPHADERVVPIALAAISYGSRKHHVAQLRIVRAA